MLKWNPAGQQNRCVMDEYLEFFLEKFGQPTTRIDATSEQIEAYRGILPDQLLEYWAKLGFSGFMDGLFWITNPADYVDELAHWIAGTELEAMGNWYVIGRGAFGQLDIWNPVLGNRYEIDPLWGWITEHKNNHQKFIKEKKSDLAARSYLGFLQLDAFEVTDEQNKPIFKKLIATHGPLGPDDMFTFKPVPFMGGKMLLETSDKVDIHIHLSILAQMGHKEVLDMRGLMRKGFGGAAKLPDELK
jgi:hypothetical protein